MPKKKGITNLNGRNKTDSTLNSVGTNINVKSVNITRIIITIIMRELISQVIEFIPLITEVLTQ
jgi:hypothetical protein